MGIDRTKKTRGYAQALLYRRSHAVEHVACQTLRIFMKRKVVPTSFSLIFDIEL